MKTLKLSTPIIVNNDIDISVDYSYRITGIGSCFSQKLLDKLLKLNFQGFQNPSGIVYNLISIQDIVIRTLNQSLYSKEDFFQFNNLWHSWEHHGSFSNKNLNDAITIANSAICEFRKNIEQSKLFILTPSSSVVYTYVKSNKITANCHKVPNKEFSRNILSVKENTDSLKNIIDSLLKINPSLKIIITLSPVRHYPGDLTLNSRSKANLLSAIHQVIDLYNSTTYFPAYEIVLDELRDYRFFKEDMIHPNDLAFKIIFQRFIDVYFAKSAKLQIEENEKKLKNLAHIQSTSQGGFKQ